jgi:protoporphyrinogen oxidase
MFETMCAYSGEDVSRKAFLAMMTSYLNIDSITFRDGIGVLPAALAARLPVELEAQVERVTLLEDGSGARVTYHQAGVERALAARAVILAVPGTQVLALLDEPRPAWRRFFPQVGYSTGALHYHVVETDYQPPVEGTFIPRATGLPINSASFEQYQDGRWLFLTDPRIYTFSMNRPERELVQEAVDTASMIFPAIRDKFVLHRLFRWQHKVPTFRPGYLDALAAFWQDPQEGPVYFCGDYFAGPSAGGALYTGQECAGRVLANL